jgi:hypothetical protein
VSIGVVDALEVVDVEDRMRVSMTTPSRSTSSSSKLAKTAAQGAREYAKSAADFLSDKKQESALEYFDVMNEPLKRKDRFIGVIC